MGGLTHPLARLLDVGRCLFRHSHVELTHHGPVKVGYLLTRTGPNSWLLQRQEKP